MKGAGTQIAARRKVILDGLWDARSLCGNEIRSLLGKFMEKGKKMEKDVKVKEINKLRLKAARLWNQARRWKLAGKKDESSKLYEESARLVVEAERLESENPL